jgi:NADP-dependent 3-hydroxy acid dehydrogenase YdfG
VAALEGKRAIVTGASSGIGQATAAALAQEGAKVVTGSRRQGNLDVTDRESCHRFVDAAVARLGGLDILVNNAGLSRGRDPVWDSLEEDEREVVETNVLGLMRMTRALVPLLEREDPGHIVDVVSTAGLDVYPNGGGYTAAKHAAHAVTTTLRLELLGRPIRVTEIDPGLVETEFSVVRLGTQEAADSVYAGMTPLTADDVADVIAYTVTRAKHVNLDQVVMRPLDQATSTMVHRRT